MIARKSEPLEAGTRLVWLPALSIARFLFVHRTNRWYPFGGEKPTLAEQRAWALAHERAEQIVVDGLPWSRLAYDAFVLRTFTELTKQEQP